MPKSTHMKASESIIILYEIIKNLKNESEAKKFVSGEIYNVICEIQEENLPLSAEEIDRRLAKIASDFKSVADADKKSIA